MKELSIEQKAKAYDEAIKRAKAIYYQGSYKPDTAATIAETLRSVFPELAESKDEKIRKELIDFVKSRLAGFPQCEKFIAWLEKQGQTFTKKDVDDAYLKGVTDTKNEIEKQYESNYQIRKDIATFIFNYRGDIKDRAKWMDYLGIKVSFGEKQGEQKSTDKAEPKFKVGDWIVFNGLSLLIKEVVQGYYRTISLGGIPNSYDWDIDNVARLWTISEAKDGDVLVNGSNIFIFHFINDTRLMGYCHVNTDDERFYDDMGKNECFCLIDAVVNPATAEQCDLLFSKMHESGYEFNFEKKELKRIEPKFKVGDWIVNKTFNLVYRVDSILFPQSKCYCLSCNGGTVLLNFADEQNYRLWTIKDAKEGDMLVTHSCVIFIFKNIMEGGTIGFHAALSTLTFASNTKIYIPKDNEQLGDQEVFPATKKQREQLEKAIADAGYTFDFEKKELKQIAQKPAWSEEDENILEAITYTVKNSGYSHCIGVSIKVMITWLKSLKDRVRPQPKQEWSEEDEREVAVLEAYIRSKDWSERHIDRALGIVDELVNKAKSLRPQNAWKPSEEQMERLKGIINSLPHQEVLYSLYQDLKKLREE